MMARVDQLVILPSELFIKIEDIENMSRPLSQSWIKFILICLLLISSAKVTVAWQPSSQFGEPFRLQADGQFIDTGSLNPNAHASPEVVDMDGDGDRDLIIGDFSGRFSWFENVGSEQTPRYLNKGYIQAVNKDARTPIYCCIASSPRLVDFDNDGVLDLISGSYDPGVIYWFRGLGQSRFAKGEKFRDRDGIALVHHPVEFAEARESRDIKAMAASFGRWPEVVDWEGDGDLDMLIGSFDGEVWLRANEGGRTSPEFSQQSIRLENVHGPMKVLGHAHPVTADWDQDGLWDMIIGAADGSVVWFQNIGSEGHPRFGPSQLLVQPVSASKHYVQLIMPGHEPKPGARAQICVTDYNADGWPDLLVGDYSECKWKKQLSANETEAYEQNLLRMDRCQQKIQAMASTAENKDNQQTLKDELVECSNIDRTFFQMIRNSSFIWVYLRRIPESTKLHESTKHPTSKPSVVDQDVDTESTARDDDDGDFRNLPVHLSTSTETVPGNPNAIRLVIELSIDSPWYVYATSTPRDLGTPMTIDLDLPAGISIAGDWERSRQEILVTKTRVEVHKEKAIWTINLVRDKVQALEKELKIQVKFQACNEKLCLPAAILTKTVAFPNTK